MLATYAFGHAIKTRINSRRVDADATKGVLCVDLQFTRDFEAKQGVGCVHLAWVRVDGKDRVLCGYSRMGVDRYKL